MTVAVYVNRTILVKTAKSKKHAQLAMEETLARIPARLLELQPQIIADALALMDMRGITVKRFQNVQMDLEEQLAKMADK